MDLVKQFREYTRQLECHFGNINSADCCCCSVNKTQCFLIVEIGRKPGISVKELAEILRIDKSGVSRFVEDLCRKTMWKENRLLKIGVLSLCIYCLKDKRDLRRLNMICIINLKKCLSKYRSIRESRY